MTTVDADGLRKFFGLRSAGHDCRLYLPTFHGTVALQTKSSSAQSGDTPAGEEFRYPGRTFADRDAKAATYIAAVLSRAIDLDGIRWEEAGDFTPGQSGTFFLFGSRSNQAAKWATGDCALGKYVHFKFGRNWSIRCAGGQIFSLSAPNVLSREDYENRTDYGVIGRYKDTGAHVFLIAGLGSRATEGCAYYLAQNWQVLARTFGRKDFALVLKFPPPIDPKKSEVVLALDDDHPGGMAISF